MADKLGVIKIHLPLDRESTKSLRADCVSKVGAVRLSLEEHGIASLVLTDHNTHGGEPFRGFSRLVSKTIDFIGASRSAHGYKDLSMKIIDTKTVPGTIDGHDFIGVRLLITWPSGRKSKIWFVQANLGRGEPASEFLANARRIKAAFKGHVVWGFDEIDEADRPDEHELLTQVWDPKKFIYCGWGTYSPVIVTPRLKVYRSRVMLACAGLAHVTPHRDLVEVVIGPKPRLIDKLKKS